MERVLLDIFKSSGNSFQAYKPENGWQFEDLNATTR